MKVEEIVVPVVEEIKEELPVEPEESEESEDMRPLYYMDTKNFYDGPTKKTEFYLLCVTDEIFIEASYNTFNSMFEINVESGKLKKFKHKQEGSMESGGDILPYKFNYVPLNLEFIVDYAKY